MISAKERSAFSFDVGGVLATWLVLLVVENLVVEIGWRDQFVSSWELNHARILVTPIALGALLPAAIVVVVLASLVGRGRAKTVATIGVLGAAAVAWGVSGGRLMQNVLVRGAFIAVVAAGGAVIGFVVARRGRSLSTSAAATVGVICAIASWLIDAFVLRRLYPAFHLALLALTLVSFSTTWLLARERLGPRARLVGTAGLIVTMLCLAWTPRAARNLSTNDNLRRILVEHAPLLGRSVLVATRISPPPPIDEGAETATSSAIVRADTERVLDWTGRDIVLLTIDALRADHLSAYGYARKTTPNIDALASRGTRFDHAYCPTPHTSYSVASMLTGKYMRPLLAMNAGEDSETWADHLRRYGYRTAAFYPPAVFFIDEHRFTKMKSRALGFEYRKAEFAAPALRSTQVADYLAGAPKETPLFLWVHVFEPHEPYVMHPEHPFGGAPEVDAYDSEIAASDALVGDVVRAVEARRPGAVVIVSADHGEEFGDHGGRYHGTTVYEEQVRVPLVVVGPGVATHVVDEPVQTIDILPTVLSALDVPSPARVRGRNLGAALTGKERAGDAARGFAFAETDDYTLIAQASERLVCARKIASCTLFDLTVDPKEQRPIADRPERVVELRKTMAALERENGTLEGTALPDALRRALQGDRDAAEDVAPLLDDARVDIRRAAAKCSFRLRAPELAGPLERASRRDEDAEVRAYSVLGAARIATGSDPRVAPLLSSTDRHIKQAAALVLAEHGDVAGEGELVKRWREAFVPGAREPGELDEARELLAAFERLRSRAAVEPLVASLPDVRLRPHVAHALGEIGDVSARAPLVTFFAKEVYGNARPIEARALLQLGARDELYAPLAEFAAAPEPMPEAIAIARDAGLLVPSRGGITWTKPNQGRGNVRLKPRGSTTIRVLVLVKGDREPNLRIAGDAVALNGIGQGVWQGTWKAGSTERLTREVDVSFPEASAGEAEAVWLLPE